jgi:hypothetical protein
LAHQKPTFSWNGVWRPRWNSLGLGMCLILGGVWVSRMNSIFG